MATHKGIIVTPWSRLNKDSTLMSLCILPVSCRWYKPWKENDCCVRLRIWWWYSYYTVGSKSRMRSDPGMLLHLEDLKIVLVHLEPWQQMKWPLMLNPKAASCLFCHHSYSSTYLQEVQMRPNVDKLSEARKLGSVVCLLTFPPFNFSIRFVVFKE